MSPARKTALPPSLRRKMGLAPRKEEDEAASEAIYKAGAGVLKPTGSAPDGTYLKRNSGVPASQRASALAHAPRFYDRATADAMFDEISQFFERFAFLLSSVIIIRWQVLKRVVETSISRIVLLVLT